MRRSVLVWTAVGIALLGAAWWWYAHSEVAPWRPALSSRAVATRALGQFLAAHYPGAKTLVFGNPFTQHSGQSAEIYAFEKASLKGLEEGLGRTTELKVVYPEVRPEFWQKPDAVFIDPKTTTPLSYLVKENAFDNLVQAHPDCELIVSLIGFPLNPQQTRLWKSEKPILALIFPDWRLLGSRETIRSALKSGKIAAAVVVRPGESLDETPVGKDPQAEFDRRFLLVTKGNIDDLLKAFPQLF